MPGVVAPVLSRFYAANRTNCSGFIKAVTGVDGLNDPLPAIQADGIIDHIRRSWISIGTGPDFGASAASFARQGYLVVAVLKASEHTHHHTSGHIAIVLPGPTDSGYPYVICGSTGLGQSDGSSSVRHSVWQAVDAPKVGYYRTSRTFPALVPPPAGGN